MKIDAPLQAQRLTPEQFKALARFKGWRYVELAVRWGVTPEWVSILARNPDRPAAYDDALHGLPNRHHHKADMARRAKRVTDAVVKASSARPSRTVPASGSVKLPSGYRYRGYLHVGTIVTAATDIGSIAEEAMRGIVFQVVNAATEERYGIIFETGLWDWFPPSYVDNTIASTGLDDSGNGEYHFDNESVLQRDFARGIFDFWPTAPGSGAG